MKRAIFLSVLFCISFAAFAQLEVKPGSFKKIDGFENSNPDKQTDDNEELYAVIKVKTENLDTQQQQRLLFEGNAATYFELEYNDSEIWVYLTAKAATFIKISHPDYGITEFWLPYDLEPKKGYEMLLANRTFDHVGNGTLVIKTQPENGAIITLNGKVLSKQTPYTNDMIPSGQYEITVSKYAFESVTRTVVVNDGETVDLNIEMPYLKCILDVVSEPAGATVFINNRECGVTPLKLDSIKYGSYDLTLKKEGCFDLNKQIVIDDGNLKTDFVLKRLPEGVIYSYFSVSATTKICFSKGNLQYQASTDTWRFANSQWDMIGEANANISEKYNGWIDLFGFGTSGYDTYAICYRPWSTDKEELHYYIRGNKGKDLTEPSVHADWGYNAISNGGNKENVWRTLTSDEWTYLFNTRKTQSGMRFVKAIVNGINGVVLLPDDWKSETYKLKEVNNGKADYKTNKIKPEEWMSKFQKNGAIFLPASGLRYSDGYRQSVKMGDVGMKGEYWSTSLMQSNSAPYIVRFTATNCGTKQVGTRSNGSSVRLVCSGD